MQGKIKFVPPKIIELSERLVVIFYIVMLVMSTSCTRRMNYVWATPKNITVDSQLVSRFGKSPCADYHSYIPDTTHPEWQPMRYVRVNIHFLRRSDGSWNFGAVEGAQYAQDMIANQNDRLMHNTKMLLPLNNNTPVFPAGFQYVLAPDPEVRNDDGIYFNDDDSLSYLIVGGRKRNVESPAAYNSFGMMKGKAINVFMIEHPEDSMKSKTYNPSNDGIGAGPWAKVIGAYYQSRQVHVFGKDTVIFGAWFLSGLFGHECGHCLGLSHTWNVSDGCDDTPFNPNCWTVNDCPGKGSNNMMDYNTYQNALTPCQIGRVQMNLSTPGSLQRNFLEPVHCEYHRESTAVISAGDSVVWEGYKDLWGDVYVAQNATLVLRCDVSLPNGAKVTLKKGAKLIFAGGTFYNSCGEQWQGIEVPKKNADTKIICAPGNEPRDIISH